MDKINITVTVSVPAGETCDDSKVSCDFWYRDAETKRCYCILFDMVELEQRFRDNMVSGKDILKCEQCRKLCGVTSNA